MTTTTDDYDSPWGNGVTRWSVKTLERSNVLTCKADGLRLLPEIQQIPDPDVLAAVLAAIKDAPTLDALRRVYTSPDTGE